MKRLPHHRISDRSQTKVSAVTVFIRVANQMGNNPRATASLTILLMFRVLKDIYGLLCQRAWARWWGKLTQTTEEQPVSCILMENLKITWTIVEGCKVLILLRSGY